MATMRLDSAMTPVPTVAYDANGNTLADPSGKSYSWDFENRLTQVVNPGVGTTTFKYDPFGRRIQKSGPLGTTNYLYDGSNLIEELDNAGNALARYTHGSGIDEPFAQLRSGATTYYSVDGLGSITSLTNSTGTIGGTYAYDTLGNLSGSTGSTANPFRYSGREFDTETGVYFYRARYYDPFLGRFLSEDEIGNDEGSNLYVYVANSPTNFRDPLGLYKLKNFPPDLAAKMRDAIEQAKNKLKDGCTSCAGPDGPTIARDIDRAVFVYVPDLQGTPLHFGNETIPTGPSCGNAEPRNKRIIKIGGTAFDPKQCCNLASTIAHEASHKLPTNYDHHQTDQLEKKCFGCALTPYP